MYGNNITQEKDMDRGKKKSIILYSVISVLFFGVTFGTTFHSRAEKHDLLQVQIVAFGDSVFGLIRDETAVPQQVQRLTGQTVYNAAFGGSCLARIEDDRRMDYAKSSLSLVGLAKAIQAGDFGVQQAFRIRESNTEYFEGVIDGLETVDFTHVETVLIQQGLNDYQVGMSIENYDDPYDEYSFLGALRTAVRALRKVNPELRIVVITPTYTWYTTTGFTCEEMDWGGGILEAYVEAELQIAEELGIEVIDVYHDFFTHESWNDMNLYTWDGLHPNEKGREMMAERIAEVLLKPMQEKEGER